MILAQSTKPDAWVTYREFKFIKSHRLLDNNATATIESCSIIWLIKYYKIS